MNEPLFWKALVNTLYFVGVGGPLTVVVSLAAALLVSSKLTRFHGMWRTIYFAPVVTTLVAVAVVWRYLYHTRYGTLNYALAGRHWADRLAGRHRWAMFAIILLAVWKNFGYNMVIFVAGLQSIPEEMYDAARIDGAGRLAHILEHQAAAAGADVFLRRRHDDDRLFPTLRRAVRDDPRRAAA